MCQYIFYVVKFFFILSYFYTFFYWTTSSYFLYQSLYQILFILLLLRTKAMNTKILKLSFFKSVSPKSKIIIILVLSQHLVKTTKDEGDINKGEVEQWLCRWTSCWVIWLAQGAFDHNLRSWVNPSHRVLKNLLMVIDKLLSN